MSAPDPESPARRDAIFGPIGADNPVELVLQRLRSSIAAGLLEQGELLPSEPDMAEQFGVAVFSIREALAQLRNEGLIVTRRGRYGGSTVQRLPDQAQHLLSERFRALSTAELRDIIDWRRMLIAEEAELAASRASSRNITRLTHYVERISQAESVAATASALVRFHMELAAAAQSAKMSAAEVGFHAQYGWLIVAGFDDPDSRNATVSDLTNMLRAIEVRNEERARSSAVIYATRLLHAIQECRMKAVRSA